MKCGLFLIAFSISAFGVDHTSSEIKVDTPKLRAVAPVEQAPVVTIPDIVQNSNELFKRSDDLRNLTGGTINISGYAGKPEEYSDPVKLKRINYYTQIAYDELETLFKKKVLDFEKSSGLSIEIGDEYAFNDWTGQITIPWFAKADQIEKYLSKLPSGEQVEKNRNALVAAVEKKKEEVLGKNFPFNVPHNLSWGPKAPTSQEYLAEKVKFYEFVKSQLPLLMGREIKTVSESTFSDTYYDKNQGILNLSMKTDPAKNAEVIRGIPQDTAQTFDLLQGIVASNKPLTDEQKETIQNLIQGMKPEVDKKKATKELATYVPEKKVALGVKGIIVDSQGNPVDTLANIKKVVEMTEKNRKELPDDLSHVTLYPLKLGIQPRAGLINRLGTLAVDSGWTDEQIKEVLKSIPPKAEFEARLKKLTDAEAALKKVNLFEEQKGQVGLSGEGSMSGQTRVIELLKQLSDEGMKVPGEGPYVYITSGATVGEMQKTLMVGENATREDIEKYVKDKRVKMAAEKKKAEEPPSLSLNKVPSGHSVTPAPEVSKVKAPVAQPLQESSQGKGIRAPASVVNLPTRVYRPRLFQRRFRSFRR